MIRREDPRQTDGLPLQFDAAVIVKYNCPFSAAVDVKIGPVFYLLARPYPAAEPVRFQPGIEYGDSIRDGVVDFESLTVCFLRLSVVYIMCLSSVADTLLTVAGRVAKDGHTGLGSRAAGAELDSAYNAAEEGRVGPG